MNSTDYIKPTDLTILTKNYSNMTNTNSNQPNVKIVITVPVTIVIPAAVILLFLAHNFKTAFHPKQLEQSAQTELYHFSRVEYEQLKIGMSLTEVRSILYRGIEVSRSATTATFLWENPDGSKITVTFENDRLTNKEPSSGLK